MLSGDWVLVPARVSQRGLLTGSDNEGRRSACLTKLLSAPGLPGFSFLKSWILGLLGPQIRLSLPSSCRDLCFLPLSLYASFSYLCPSP